MTLPRIDYPKRGLPAPPGLHVEDVPGIGEANREAEALINPIDGGTDLRVALPAGATPGISVDLVRLLAAIQSRGTDTADAMRAVRSALDPFRGVRCEDNYRCLVFSLAAARVAPTEILDPNGLSLAGSSVTVYSNTGTFDLYIDMPTNDPIPVAPLTWPAMAPQIHDHRFKRLFVVNTAQQGATMRLYIGRGA